VSNLLIIYRAEDGHVVSISGFHDMGSVTKEMVEAIHLVDPLPEGQVEYRVYNPTMMDKIWEAFDRGAVLQVVLDEKGNPIGVMADGEIIV